MRIAITLAAAASAIVLAGCSKPETKVDTAAIEKQIRDNETKWAKAYADHDAVALAAQYADDAALANPGAALVTGAEAIKEETAAFAADPNLKVEFSADRIQVAESGDLAYSRGHYSMTSSDPATNKATSSGGSYLTVYKKQADGNWKAVEDFITPGPSAAPASN